MYIHGFKHSGATGKDGRTGATGNKGIKGTTGAKGTKGTDGIKGVKGLTGDKGKTGSTGKQGIKGDTGARGLLGRERDERQGVREEIVKIYEMVEISIKSGEMTKISHSSSYIYKYRNT